MFLDLSVRRHQTVSTLLTIIKCNPLSLDQIYTIPVVLLTPPLTNSGKMQIRANQISTRSPGIVYSRPSTCDYCDARCGVILGELHSPDIEEGTFSNSAKCGETWSTLVETLNKQQEELAKKALAMDQAHQHAKPANTKLAESLVQQF